MADQSNFRDAGTASELEVQDKTTLLEWFANEYKKFGCTLEFVTNKSQEGSQFCRGFGGIGGILRYQLDIRSFDELSDDGEVYEDSDLQSINYYSDPVQEHGAKAFTVCMSSHPSFYSSAIARRVSSVSD